MDLALQNRSDSCKYYDFLDMRLITAFCFILIWMPATAKATVYEFNSDGSVTVHDTASYTPEEKKQPQKQNKPSGHSSQFESIIEQASQKYGVSPALIHAVILQESAYDPNAISPKGAIGLMQLMPQTAKRFNVRNSFDPEENIFAGTKLLSTLLRKYNHNMARALAAYNAGEGAVSKYDGIPPFSETQQYVQKIILQLK